MQVFEKHTGLAIPLDRSNVDTDLIIPKQFLKSIKRTGFGPNLFDSLRYEDEGEIGQDCSQRPLRTDFVMNQARYAGGTVLLARENFGCGSSREHAPWALMDYGIRAVIASSFADIFYNNSFKNGLLPVVIEAEQLDQLFSYVTANTGAEVLVDLENCVVGTPDGQLRFAFAIDEFRRECLLKGLDEIGVTLESADAITAFEQKQKAESPWLYTE